MPRTLKLISLNIHGNKYLDLQIPFFKAQSPDVLCLQEIFESDYQSLKGTLGMDGNFAVMYKGQRMNKQGKKNPTILGIALLSKLPLEITNLNYYFGSPRTVQEFVRPSMQERVNKVLLHSRIRKIDGSIFIVGTTHFTWSPAGMADNNQRRDLKALLKNLDSIPEIVFCGDFNAPRGREIFTAISQKYKDNIPPTYTTSIDGNLHEAGHLELMVDGLFSTPKYAVQNVRLVDGVSDHYAIIAEITRQ